MDMFCFQCQETARGTGCTVRGVCGKTAEVATLMDLLVHALKGISNIVVHNSLDVFKLEKLNHEVVRSLFMTITNANFDDDVIEKQIKVMVDMRDQLAAKAEVEVDHDSVVFQVGFRENMLEKAASIGVLSTEDEDIRSLRELNIYGLKGMSAYVEHAVNLGKDDPTIYEHIYKTLAATTDDSLTVDDLVTLTLKTGEYGVKAMALLDEANTSAYGHPEITTVDLGVRDNPAILISGHDLYDMEQLLEQTENTGVDVYTHGEMLPAQYYPAFKKYDHFAGNYGGSWWRQKEEFVPFNGPILFTTNCIVPTANKEVLSRIFTTGSSGYPGCKHIEINENGKKDFSEIIKLAKTLPAPEAIESGQIVGGFAHHQVAALEDKVVEAVKSGDIRKFVVMGGCDGRMKNRNYYTEFAEALPKDTVILTAGCAKYRYNKLDLGDINGIPRVLDAGQCNDSYSVVVIAKMLQKAFGLDDINDLPIAYNIAWYEQKAVIVLLALLHLGVKNIRIGPSLPGFFSPNVNEVLVNHFGLSGNTTVDADIEMMI